jgi:Uri superfamily endonuclease
MLPDQSGTYALILSLPRCVTIDVGRLGRFQFPAGWYVYTGSARGPGGLAARVSRHLRSSKRLHWHVDYLRAEARPDQIWYVVGTRKRECVWARRLASFPGASIPVPRFGASDCHCPSHLIHFATSLDLAALIRALGEPISQERLHV